MAQFELNIYGKDDEITKTLKTDKVRWGIFMQALEVSDELEERTPGDQFKIINKFIKKIFPDLTDDDLENADSEDVMNTFKQLVRKANKIGGGENSKNAERVA